MSVHVSRVPLGSLTVGTAEEGLDLGAMVTGCKVSDTTMLHKKVLHELLERSRKVMVHWV